MHENSMHLNLPASIHPAGQYPPATDVGGTVIGWSLPFSFLHTYPFLTPQFKTDQEPTCQYQNEGQTNNHGFSDNALFCVMSKLDLLC